MYRHKLNKFEFIVMSIREAFNMYGSFTIDCHISKIVMSKQKVFQLNLTGSMTICVYNVIICKH